MLSRFRTGCCGATLCIGITFPFIPLFLQSIKSFGESTLPERIAWRISLHICWHYTKLWEFFIFIARENLCRWMYENCLYTRDTSVNRVESHTYLDFAINGSSNPLYLSGMDPIRLFIFIYFVWSIRIIHTLTLYIFYSDFSGFLSVRIWSVRT